MPCKKTNETGHVADLINEQEPVVKVTDPVSIDEMISEWPRMDQPKKPEK